MKCKFIDQDNEDFSNLFMGSSYPQRNEYKQFINLCEIVKENYICCDPMDDENEDFRVEPNVREFECATVMGQILNKFEAGTVGGPEKFN